MSWTDLDKLWVPFLTAVAVALVNWAQNHRVAARARHADRIQQQIHKLYGPLYVGWFELRDMLLHNIALMEATYKTFGGDDKADQPDKDQAFKVFADNVNKLQRLNKRLARVIATNFALCEPEDVELFLRCITQFAKTEIESTLPAAVRKELGEIDSFGQEMALLLEKRFKQLANQWRNVAKA